MAESGANPMTVDAVATDANKKRTAGEADTGCSERERFLLELEFVQNQQASIKGEGTNFKLSTTSFTRKCCCRALPTHST
eukprot:scaffold4491_cov40-Prasinocladus_malaysianus.AAC.1